MTDLKKVLVVDDSSLSRRMIRSLILAKFPDCTVLEAGTGDEGLLLVENNIPDLITLDVNMPGMSTYEAAVQLKQKCPTAKMAIITANIQQSVRQKIQSLGIMFLAVIEKPITEEGMKKIFDAL